MSGHTPGPWTVAHSFRGVYSQHPAPGPVQICRAPENYEWPKQWEANARLIAAAPDSHEANVRTVQAFNEVFGINETWTDERIYDDLPSSTLALAYFAARDAIAKATGGQP